MQQITLRNERSRLAFAKLDGIGSTKNWARPISAKFPHLFEIIHVEISA
jgi:hypothetical protein